MVNNSERSKQWRNQRKNDPTFLENERKRKKESRKNRTEEQRKRDKELCKARQKKYRQKQRALLASSEDTVDNQLPDDCTEHTEDYRDVSVPDKDTIRSTKRSEEPNSLCSVSQAVDKTSSSIPGQSIYCEHVNRSADNNVVVAANYVEVSEHDVQPSVKGEDRNNIEPLIYEETSSSGNQLQHPDLDSSSAYKILTSDIGVVQASLDVVKTEDANSSRLLSSVLATSNSVLHGEEEDWRSLGSVSNSDSISDEMEEQEGNVSEKPSKFASEIGTGKDGNAKGKTKQPIGSASVTTAGIDSEVIGVTEQGSRSVLEAGNMEGRDEQSDIVRNVNDKDKNFVESASKRCARKAENMANVSEQANEPMPTQPVGPDAVISVVIGHVVHSKTESLDEGHVVQNMSGTLDEGQVVQIVEGHVVKSKAGSIDERHMVQIDEGHVLQSKAGSLDEGHMVQKKASTHSSLTGKKTTKWIQQYAEGENHDVVTFLNNNITFRVESQREAFFVRLQRELSQIADFDELKSRSGEVFREIEKRFPMPAMQTLTLSGHQHDVTASSLYPQDAPPDHVPIQIIGDGNCLPRVGSLFAFGNDRRHQEIRVRIFIELCQFEDTYLNDSYLNRGLETDKQTKKTATLIAQYSDVFTKDVQVQDRDKYVYRVNAKNVLYPRSYNGMWSVFALASVIGVRVRSIYPDYGGHNVREDHNRMVIPRVSRDNDTVINIMWTNTLGKLPLATAWTPNHFVAVVHKNTIDDNSLRSNGGTSEGKSLEQSVGAYRTGAYDRERLVMAHHHGPPPPPQTIARFTTGNTCNNIVTVTHRTHHPLIGDPILRNKDMCISHPYEKPVYLCNTCKDRPICYKCHLQGHKNHEYEDLELHLEKRENEYIEKAKRKRVLTLQTEFKRQKDVNELNRRKIAREIDERVASIDRQVQRWRHQYHQKLQEDAKAIHDNITLSGERVSATIPDYITNLKQQLQQLSPTERLERMSEDPPTDVAVDTCIRIQFTPGNDHQLIQHFGSLSCNLSDRLSSDADVQMDDVVECDNTTMNPAVRNIQPYVSMNQSNRTAIQRLDTKNSDEEKTTSSDLPTCSRPKVSNNRELGERLGKEMNSTQNEHTPSKRPRVNSNAVDNTQKLQKLERSVNSSLNVIHKQSSTASTVSATNEEERKQDDQCISLSSFVLNTQAVPQVVDNTDTVQQIDKPDVDVSPNLNEHQKAVSPHFAYNKSSGTGLKVRSISINPCSEARIPVGQRINISPDPTASPGMQSSDEQMRYEEIPQAPRKTETLGAGDNGILSQARITNKVKTATCKSTSNPRGITDSGPQCNSVMRAQKEKSTRPLRSTTTTQHTGSEFVQGSRLMATGSHDSRKKTVQSTARQPRKQTDIECKSATGLKLVMKRANSSTLNDLELLPRANIAVNGICAINSTIVRETSATVHTDVIEGMEPKPDEKDGMPSRIHTTTTVKVTSPSNVDQTIKTTTTVGTVIMANAIFTGATNCNCEATQIGPKTNTNVSGAIKNTSVEQMSQITNVNVIRVAKASNLAGATRTDIEHVTGVNKTEHVARISPKTTVNIKGKGKANSSVETPCVDNYVPERIKTASVARQRPRTNGHVHCETNVTKAVGSAPTVVSKDTCEAMKTLIIARASPLAKSKPNDSTEIINPEGTIPKPTINFSGETDTLNKVKTTSLADNVVDGSTRIKSQDGTTLVVNKNETGIIKTATIINAEETIPKPYITFIGSTGTATVVEPSSVENKNVATRTKVTNLAKRTSVMNRKEEKARNATLSNTNVKGTPNHTESLVTTPIVNETDTGTIKSENTGKSTTMPKRKVSTKLKNTAKTATKPFINLIGAASTNKQEAAKAWTNKSAECLTEIGNIEGTTKFQNTEVTIQKSFINITGATEIANVAESSPMANINVIPTAESVHEPKPTHQSNIAEPGRVNLSKRSMPMTTDDTAVVRKKQARTRSVERKVLCSMEVYVDNTTEER